MLFLFVLMLVGVDSSDSLVETIKGQRVGVGPARRSASPACSSLGIGAASSLGSRAVGLDAGQRRRGNVHGHRRADLRPVRLRLRGHLARCSSPPPSAPWCSRTASASTPRSHRRPSWPSERVRDDTSTPPACPAPVSTPGTTRSTPRPCCPTARRPSSSGARGVAASAPRRRSATAPTAAAARRTPSDGRRRRRRSRRASAVSPTHYVYLSAILFTIGAAGVLMRRNAIIVFMGVELMLNATQPRPRHLRPDARHPRRAGHRLLRHGRRRRRGRRRASPSS